LKEAIEEWKSDEICMKALGKEVAEKYVELKMSEWKEYELNMPKNEIEVTPWEVKKYLYA
jgi:glutamine synthetase